MAWIICTLLKASIAVHTVNSVTPSKLRDCFILKLKDILDDFRTGARKWHLRVHKFKILQNAQKLEQCLCCVACRWNSISLTKTRCDGDKGIISLLHCFHQTREPSRHHSKIATSEREERERELCETALSRISGDKSMHSPYFSHGPLLAFLYSLSKIDTEI